MTDDRTVRPLWDGRLNLEQQKKRAKELLRGLLAEDPAACERLQASHPRAERLRPKTAQLADAQLVVARENGFASWPNLKAHAEQLKAARASIAANHARLDSDRCLHVRCGSDLRKPLREAGFSGAFHEFSDPLCQGPLRDLPRAELIELRSAFIAETFGIVREAVRKRTAAEYGFFDRLGDYDEVVLWFEHDLYDQAVLAYLLKELPQVAEPQLSLVCVDRVPGVQTFFGLGQLAPEVLRLLFARRTPVGEAERSLGARVWSALTSPSPEALHRLATGASAVPAPMAPALLRHLQELPSTRSGLSLTEHLTLELLAVSGPMQARALFAKLGEEREAAPFLGDMMYWPILRELTTIGILDAPPAGDHHAAWPKRTVALTPLGESVRMGQADRVALGADRWCGAIHVRTGQPCWRWDETARRPVFTA